MRGWLEIGCGSVRGLFAIRIVKWRCVHCPKENLKRRGPSFQRIFVFEIGVCIRQVGYERGA
jgi:hypothetical protein